MLWPALKVNRGISIGNSLFDEARDVGCQEKIDHPEGQIPWNLNYEMGTLYTPGYETSFSQNNKLSQRKNEKMEYLCLCIYIFIHILYIYICMYTHLYIIFIFIYGLRRFASRKQLALRLCDKTRKAPRLFLRSWPRPKKRVLPLGSNAID